MVIVQFMKRHWPAYLLAFFYISICFALMVLKHNAFNTRIHDFARFSHAIWNTLDGQFLYTTLSKRSILGDHFSPVMALAAPLLWVYPDENALFLVQATNVAATGLILYHLMYHKSSNLAPWLALVFFFNPAVHEVTLFEFRRIVFGMPWLALGLYGLILKRYRIMVIGLIIALLAKESIAIYVLMIGIYLLLFEHNWRWGIGLTVLGIGWAVIVGSVIIPAFNQDTKLYPQIYYYEQWGGSYMDIVKVALHDPLSLMHYLFGSKQVLAIGRVLFPLAFLIILDLRLVFITLPYLALMFLSNDIDMMQLDKWYTATLTPVLFAAIISGWQKISSQWQKWAMQGMFAMTLIAYVWYGYAPFGGRFDLSIYQATSHDKLSQAMIDRVPTDVSISAHPRYIPHLTHMNTIYSYKTIDNADVDYLLMDRQIYFSHIGVVDPQAETTNLVIDPSYTVVEEVDDIYLLSTQVAPLPAYSVQKIAEEKIYLDRVEIATPDELGFYEPVTGVSPLLKSSETIRVTLYWEALADNIGERTVSVRLTATDGYLLAQQDQIPTEGVKPTSWWKKGWQVRDIYYLTLPANTSKQLGSLDIVLYDTYTREIIPFAGEGDVMSVVPIQIVNE